MKKSIILGTIFLCYIGNLFAADNGNTITVDVDEFKLVGERILKKAREPYLRIKSGETITLENNLERAVFLELVEMTAFSENKMRKGWQTISISHGYSKDDYSCGYFDEQHELRIVATCKADQPISGCIRSISSAHEKELFEAIRAGKPVFESNVKEFFMFLGVCVELGLSINNDSDENNNNGYFNFPKGWKVDIKPANPNSRKSSMICEYKDENETLRVTCQIRDFAYSFGYSLEGKINCVTPTTSERH